jgi:hypothetical protein
VDIVLLDFDARVLAPMAERLLEPLEWSYAPLSDPAGLSGVSAVVVLGAGWRSEWQAPASIRLSESSALRLLEGLRLIEALPEARLLVSGASRNRDRLPVAVGYAEAAQALGVDPSRIVVLDTPVDTAQEAYAVREAWRGRAVSARHVGCAHAAGRSALRARGPRPDSRSHAFHDRHPAGVHAVVLAALRAESAENGARDPRVPGFVGAGVGSLTKF